MHTRRKRKFLVNSTQLNSTQLNSTQLNGITRIYAFDSFQGIQGVSKSEITGPYKEGGYSASYAEFINNLRSNNIAENQIEVIPGFFKETLTENFYAKYFLHDSIAAVVNIDCDIYEPAKLALNFVKPMLKQGSIVLFDDWYSYALDPNKGEVLALREFLAENTKMQFMFWKDYGPVGRAFIVSISTST